MESHLQFHSSLFDRFEGLLRQRHTRLDIYQHFQPNREYSSSRRPASTVASTNEFAAAATTTTTRLTPGIAARVSTSRSSPGCSFPHSIELSLIAFVNRRLVERRAESKSRAIAISASILRLSISTRLPFRRKPFFPRELLRRRTVFFSRKHRRRRRRS